MDDLESATLTGPELTMQKQPDITDSEARFIAACLSYHSGPPSPQSFFLGKIMATVRAEYEKSVRA